MCKCKSTEVQTYHNQIEVTPPKIVRDYLKKDTLCIDKCIADEVRDLWSKGIVTTGCCCGHNHRFAYIGVIDEDIPKMLVLGYKAQYNHSRPGDKDTFHPKKHYIYEK